MTIEARVVLDSIAPNGARLTTFELTYPRFIHAELMTHREFSRNAASSRAIPTPKKIERIRADCAKPSEWGVNMKGMQAAGPLSTEDARLAGNWWENARDDALKSAEVLCGIRCATCGIHNSWDGASGCSCDPADARRLDLHKQVANRIVEPFDHITVVLSTTKLKNHFKLRLETDPVTGRPMADPTYFELATKWKAAYDASTPTLLHPGEWHLPYVAFDAHGTRIISREDQEAIRDYMQKEMGDGWVFNENANMVAARKVSVGRCARVSYMRQGKGDVEDNVKLHDALSKNGHWSPFEHVATPMIGMVFGTCTGPHPCGYCKSEIKVADKLVNLNGENICAKCARGHISSGNFHGWNQYRKEFANEAGGD